MKRKDLEHEEALRLRKLGWSYSAIKEKLGLSKSTLSVWLRDYPLSKKEIYQLQHSEQVIEKFRETMRKKRQEAIDDAVEAQQNYIGSLSKRELYMCGLGLFWGEGGKTIYSEITFSNTDVRMIKFFLKWLEECIEYPMNNLKIKLHLYSDMNVDRETKYWSRALNLPIYMFGKPYVKSSRLSKLTYKTRGHGTCNVRASGVKYSRSVFGGMEVLSRMY